MRKFAIAAASVAFLASGAAALAAEQYQGTVETVNPAAGTLTLKSGQSFQFANGTVFTACSRAGSRRDRQRHPGIGAFDPHPAQRDGDVN